MARSYERELSDRARDPDFDQNRELEHQNYMRMELQRLGRSTTLSGASLYKYFDQIISSEMGGIDPDAFIEKGERVSHVTNMPS